MKRLNQKNIFYLVCVVVVMLAILSPFLASAQNLVPCHPVADPKTGIFTNDCNYAKLIELGQKIINYAVIISIPLAAISFAWAGALFVTAAGNESQIKKAKEIFTKVAIGFAFVLTAWMIVYLITHTLLSPTYFDSSFPIKQ